MHPHCTIAQQRISDARAAVQAMPTVANHWLKDSILFELGMIELHLAEISSDHHLKGQS